MFFEMWLKQKGLELKNIGKKEGRELYRQWGLL